MSSFDEKYILGNWKYDNGKGVLSIEKIGETYKCMWKIEKENTYDEYLGIGIIVDNKLFVSRYRKQVPMAGVGMYRKIGDLRSNSAMWASTQSFNILGSGIALRKETSESFEGNYKVRYFVKEYESPVFDLKIIKNEQNHKLYNLNWSINDEVQLHGIGTIDKEKMYLAYGGVNFEYEIGVFSSADQNTLSSQYASVSNFNIKEEIYTR